MLRSAEDRGFTNVEKTIAMTPVRRMGRPEDIAARSAHSSGVRGSRSYITGQILGREQAVGIRNGLELFNPTLR